MTTSIAASPARSNTRPATRTVRGTTMHLHLVQPTPANALPEPRISFDAHAGLLAKGYLTLAEAGALSAALDDLRAKAAQ